MYKTVRDGRKVWPYCTECGCRLSVYAHDDDDEKNNLSHYGFYTDRDARGCYCPNLEIVSQIYKNKLLYL